MKCNNGVPNLSNLGVKYVLNDSIAIHILYTARVLFYFIYFFFWGGGGGV